MPSGDRHCGVELYTTRSPLCLGCSAVETLRAEFRSEFASGSSRALCVDIAVSAARQVRAFRLYCLRREQDQRRSPDPEAAPVQRTGFTLKPVARVQDGEEEPTEFPVCHVPPRTDRKAPEPSTKEESEYSYETGEEDPPAGEEEEEGYSSLDFPTKAEKSEKTDKAVGATAKSAAAPALANQDESRTGTKGFKEEGKERMAKAAGSAFMEEDLSHFGYYSCEDPLHWPLLQISVDNVMEMELPREFALEPGVTASFLVTKVESYHDSSFTVTARSLGSTNEGVTKRLSTLFNRRVGCFHVCLGDICDYFFEEKEGWHFHVTAFTLADVRTFEADYIGMSGRRLVRNCREGVLEDVPEELEPTDDEAAGSAGGNHEGKGRGGAPAPKKKVDKADPGKDKRKREAPKKKPDPTGEDGGDKGDDKKKNADLRARLNKIREKQTGNPKEKEDDEDGSPKKDGKEGTAGMSLPRELRLTGGQKLPKLGTELEAMVRAQKGTSPDKQKRGNQQEGGSPAEKEFQKMLTSGKGEVASSSGSSSGSEKCLPPLKKRSHQSPGAVLKMLIATVEEHLSAIGEVDLRDSGGMGGTRILTYYNSLIKGGINPVSRDGRELFLLAVSLDQLRQGELARLGDGLSARFLALHQATLDGGWEAARNLEIHTPELVAAAPAAGAPRSRDVGGSTSYPDAPEAARMESGHSKRPLEEEPRESRLVPIRPELERRQGQAEKRQREVEGLRKGKGARRIRPQQCMGEPIRKRSRPEREGEDHLARHSLMPALSSARSMSDLGVLLWWSLCGPGQRAGADLFPHLPECSKKALALMCQDSRVGMCCSPYGLEQCGWTDAVCG
eukprot:Skav233565  [mRNA]  locus=scaffold563:698171:702408:- [translate_table: standard]